MLWFLHILGGLPCQGGMLLAGTNRNLSVLNSRHVDWLSHIEDDGYFGWWFQMCFIFTPIWGRFPILMNIFQTGCNRQLVVDTARGEPLCKPNLCWTFVRFKQLCGGTSRELQTSMESRMSFHVSWLGQGFRWSGKLGNFCFIILEVDERLDLSQIDNAAMFYDFMLYYKWSYDMIIWTIWAIWHEKLMIGNLCRPGCVLWWRFLKIGGVMFRKMSVVCHGDSGTYQPLK